MKSFKSTQNKEIANALNNVSKLSGGDFVVEFKDTPYGDFKVKCFHDSTDDSIGVTTIGYDGVSWFHNTPKGRENAFEMLID
jgi:hypothetical protein